MKPTICPGNRVCCPSCGKPLPLLDIRNGDGFATCPHKIGRFETRRNCGQHIYFICTERLCSVFKITREQYDRFADGHHAPAEILAELGAELREAA
jgi:hypothetical protein